MSKITTFLTFNDRAEEAVDFYTKIFKRSKVNAKTYYGDSGPMPKGLLMTADFELDGERFVALNGGSSFTFSLGISLMVNCETQADVDYYWSKLVEGGGAHNVCGWLTDKFGVAWQVVPVQLMQLLTSKDKPQFERVMNAMMQMTKIEIAGIEAAARG
ncbi:MAG TPA: VOC family protein [Kofleriaceae bacterium]|jgi:predicted 3-demethylubiquinone-9 3-methyltransferase (glyoxalase superfamily)|nr:VOC family protein [Kofleriaceae bacterium]